MTDPVTGAVAKRRLVPADEVAFTIRMALRGSALSGLPHRDRPYLKEAIERAIIEHFRLCRYQVVGAVAENGPIGDPGSA
jgi:hypothetical protein